eukprot:TRINITY_DN3964_c0_g1_i1.p2 TRINITY_DN3964_c0_g1~~TRINITY_DN3964_c0_g1_i1.p2  ORF type:complete len:227 (-),score=19.06 TRINITY_DN3964_c0_g1_i1:143-754(-)
MQNSKICCRSTLSQSVRSQSLSSRVHIGTQRLLTTSYKVSRLSRGANVKVWAGKGKGSKYRAPTQQAPPTPEIDKENEEFVIFIKPAKLAQWMPYSLIKGTPAANQLVRSMQSKWGKVLFSNTVIRNIGNEVYKSEEEIVNAVKSKYKEFAKFTEFQFGFKIRDKTNPKEWYLAQGLTIIPPKEELGKAPLQALVERFTGQSA